MAPLALRSFFFGLMLLAWWVLTVEVPGRMLFRIVVQRGIERQYTSLSVWAYSITQTMMGYRGLGIALIMAAMVFHYWLWTRLPRYDVYGRWLFKAGFLVLYIVLYTFFLLVFLGAELPVWTWPQEIIPPETQ